MVDRKLLEILVCPVCKGPLRHQALAPASAREELLCRACALAYPVEDDIPVMLEDEARRVDAAELVS